MASDLIEPVAIAVDFSSGALAPMTSHIRRRISDMRGMYADRQAEEALIAAGDPLVYEVIGFDVPPDPGQLAVCTTILHPGRVGDEYFMTKGHYHALRDRAEVYLGLRGRGILVLEADGQSRELDLLPGTAAYVPPYWAHRTVNAGDEPLIFLAVYPGDAGHDYGTIEREGFLHLVLAAAAGPHVRSRA